MTATETQTPSALSDYVKDFLIQFKDKSGSYRYVEDIDKMMSSKSRYINVDYNDLVTHPEIESKFNEDPDEILEAFGRAIKEILNEFKGHGLTKIVALRGDLPSGIGGFGDFPYALDLIKFIKREQKSFSIEVAAYPEVHPDAESENTDFKNFLNKVDAGADGAITQFFFEEDSYFKFMEKCEKEKVTIPIIPGVLTIHDFEALVRMAKNC